MTRRDLEEAIINLEYLLGLKPADAEKKEEYEQQLQAFRLVLQAVNQQQLALASARKRTLGSDVKIALMYAEEELFRAAQALKTAQQVDIAHRHLRHVLEHEHSLPAEIAKCVASLDAAYSRREDTGVTREAGADALTIATKAVLDAVRDELGAGISTLHA